MRKLRITTRFSALFIIFYLLLTSINALAVGVVLVRYDFSGLQAGKRPGYIAGDAVISEKGAWLDALGKKAVFSAPEAAESVSLLASIRSAGYVLLKLYDGENYQQVNFKPDTKDWESLLIDIKEGNLTVLCGGRQVMVKGSLNISRIEKIEIANAEIDDVSLGEQTLPTRIVDFNVCYDGVGAPLVAHYIYYSQSGTTETPYFTWYASDSLNGTYERIKSSTQVWAPNPGEDKYVYCTASYSGGTAGTIPKKVSDLDVMIFNEAKSLVGGAETTFVYKDSDGTRYWRPRFADWSDYDEIVFNIRSARSTDRFYQVYLSSDNPNYSSNDYYFTYFKVDWGGNTDRQLVFKIGEDEGLETSGHQVGFHAMTGVAFYTRLNQSQKEDGGAFAALEADPSTRTDLWISGVYLRKSQSARDEVLWEDNYILNDLKKNNQRSFSESIMTKAHPRLLLTHDKLEQLKADVVTEPYLKKSFERLQSTVAGYVKNGPLTVTSSATANYVAGAALLYNLQPNAELKAWIWQSCENLSKNVTTWNPDSRSFLSVGDTMRSMAMTYDWMYNHWNEAERKTVRNAIMLHGFRAVLPKLRSETHWSVGGGNWCQSLLSGAGMGALAICDNDDYAAICDEVLERVIFGLGYGMQDFHANGSYPEGTAYWQYAMDCFSPFETALSAVCGSNYGLMDGEGMAVTGYFPIMMTGMRGTFNFSDATNVASTISHSYYRLSEYFNNPAFGNYQYTNTKANGGNFLSMLLYNTDGYDDFHMPNYSYYSGATESFVMRTDYEKGTDGMYLGFKGGDNQSGHGQLDVGIFVYDYKNIRWFWDLGRDSYDYASRWEHYRNRAEGNNCLVINPSTAPDQNPVGFAPIREYKVTDGVGYGIIDMTDVYDTSGATKAERGFMMLNDFNTLIIQDEVKAESITELYSFMHLGTGATVSADQKSALLASGSKRLYVYLLSNCDAALEIKNAELLKLSPTPTAFSNAGIKKLAVKAKNVSDPTITVVITPYAVNPLTQIVPLSEWGETFVGMAAEPMQVTVNGHALEKPYETAETVSELSASVTVSNLTAEETEVWLTAACYVDGKLFETQTAKVRVGGKQSAPVSVSYTNPKGKQADLKLMLWTADLQPLARPIQICQT